MKELFDKRFWRGVVKTFVEAREGVNRENVQPRPAPSPSDPPKPPRPRPEAQPPKG